MTAMQFGVFGVGYLNQEPPVTGPVVGEEQTIQDTMLLAQNAEGVGLDVSAFGEHHNPIRDAKRLARPARSDAAN